MTNWVAEWLRPGLSIADASGHVLRASRFRGGRITWVYCALCLREWRWGPRMHAAARPRCTSLGGIPAYESIPPEPTQDFDIEWTDNTGDAPDVADDELIADEDLGPTMVFAENCDTFDSVEGLRKIMEEQD